mmetsp:Transcript_3309/g.11425  ORF Transcript_3309/g.11425 Transcript_3309/m.11425 type:complete len:270 (-) Transcript_3309:556-1365(-)
MDSSMASKTATSRPTCLPKSRPRTGESGATRAPPSLTRVKWSLTPTMAKGWRPTWRCVAALAVEAMARRALGVVPPSRRAAAAAKSRAWMSSRDAARSAAASAAATDRFSPPRRLATTTTPSAASRGPTSTRSGTPLRSHSKNLAPGRMFGRSSTLTRTPSALHSATRPSTRASTASVPASSFFRVIGTTATWTGATRGGSTRPASSEWVMTSAPSSRVDTPQDVAQTSSRFASLFWNWTSKARAKFCPRKCDVPLWSAQPLGIKASMV